MLRKKKDWSIILKYLLKYASFELFCPLYIIDVLAMVIFKSLVLFEVLLTVNAIIFIIRIFTRQKYLNELRYVTLHEKGIEIKEDTEQRINQIGDIIAVLVILALSLSFHVGINENVIERIFLILVCSGVYFLFVYGSIKIGNALLKVIPLLIVSLQGMLIVLIGICVALLLVCAMLSGAAQGDIMLEVKDASTVLMNSISNDSMIILLPCIGYLLEQVPIFTFASMLFACFLYLIYIFLTPVGQLGNLVMAFKILNVMIVLLGIIVFFGANEVAEIIITSINNNLEIIEEIEAAGGEFTNYINQYSKSNIKDLMYVLLLPYTFGMLIANWILEKVNKRNTRIQKQILEEIVNDQSLEGPQLYDMKKKYYYYGGEYSQLWCVEELKNVVRKCNDNSAILPKMSEKNKTVEIKDSSGCNNRKK